MSAKNKATTLRVETVKVELQAEINALKSRVLTLEMKKQGMKHPGNTQTKKEKRKRLPKLQLSQTEQAKLDKMKEQMDKKAYRKAARTYIKELRAAQRVADLEAMRDDENDIMRDAERDYQREVARAHGVEPGEDVYHAEGKIRQPSFGGGMGRRAMLSRWG